jgi:hypothetical protein
VHEAERSRRQSQRDFAFVALAALAVEQHHVVSRKRLAHRPGLHRESGSIAYQRRRFSLTVAVANRDAPCLLHGFDDFGIQRFAGARELAQLWRTLAKLLERDHSPYGWRCTQRVDVLPPKNVDGVMR